MCQLQCYFSWIKASCVQSLQPANHCAESGKPLSSTNTQVRQGNLKSALYVDLERTGGDFSNVVYSTKILKSSSVYLRSQAGTDRCSHHAGPNRCHHFDMGLTDTRPFPGRSAVPPSQPDTHSGILTKRKHVYNLKLLA